MASFLDFESIFMFLAEEKAGESWNIIIKSWSLSQKNGAVKDGRE